MNRIVVERRVNNDGFLQLTLSLGPEEAGRDVRVTIDPVGRKGDDCGRVAGRHSSDGRRMAR